MSRSDDMVGRVTHGKNDHRQLRRARIGVSRERGVRSMWDVERSGGVTAAPSAGLVLVAFGLTDSVSRLDLRAQFALHLGEEKLAGVELGNSRRFERNKCYCT